MVKPEVKREVVEFVKDNFGHSNSRSCDLIGLWRSTQHYKSKNPNKDDAVKKRMRQLAEENTKWGCPMIHDVLKIPGTQYLIR